MDNFISSSYRISNLKIVYEIKTTEPIGDYGEWNPNSYWMKIKEYRGKQNHYYMYTAEGFKNNKTIQNLMRVRIFDT